MQDSKTRSNLQLFYEKVEMPGGWMFDHVHALKKIDLYYNGKFETGNTDDQGFYKFFYNIVVPACDIATKFIDLDTKDIILHPEGTEQEMKVWIMQKKLKYWLKENGFATLLNEMAEDLPKYGHVVVKKAKGRPYRVRLENLRMNPGASRLSDSSFVYEVHLMNKAEMEEEGWDVSEIEEDKDYIVYECYDKKGKGWVRTIKTEILNAKQGEGWVETAESQINDHNEYAPSIILSKEKMLDKLPYRETKWKDMPGRWLGLGFVEFLEDNQIAANETENLERKGLAFKALQMWQTRDDTVGGSNILTGAQNGDVLKIESELTVLPKDNSDLSAFNNTRSNWRENTVAKTFSQDIAAGGDLPSRTPLGVANLQAGMVSSFFELRRENFGIFVKELILEDIIPSFKNDSRKKHVLTFLGSDEDIDKLDEAITQMYVDQAKVDYANKTGFFPSKLQLEDMELRIREQEKRFKHRYVHVKDSFYDDAKFWLDVNITGESFDVGVKSQVIEKVMNIYGANPAIMQDPIGRRMIYMFLTLGGINPVDLNMTGMPKAAQTPLQPSGSIAKSSPAEAGMAPMTQQI